MTSFPVNTSTSDKRQLFIDAAIHSLSEHGYKATTVREIAKTAGVTPGLLTHYFSGKEVLIAESYAYLAKVFLERFENRIEGLQHNPVAALKTFIDATFDKDNLDPKLLKVWLSFWSLTLNEPDLKHIHRQSYRHYIDAIEHLLSNAYKRAGKVKSTKNVRALAIGINALLDGLWIEWCLDPDTFSPEEGLKIVYDFVESSTGLILNGA